ncbi:hypothetical protein BDZ91DRAFT_712262 [Kalaharituber pfeilii]|nr:hypothetical protein BDZ91DRAFT_712262 [Kalaharituber pfeilii]
MTSTTSEFRRRIQEQMNEKGSRYSRRCDRCAVDSEENKPCLFVDPNHNSSKKCDHCTRVGKMCQFDGVNVLEYWKSNVFEAKSIPGAIKRTMPTASKSKKRTKNAHVRATRRRGNRQYAAPNATSSATPIAVDELEAEIDEGDETEDSTDGLWALVAGKHQGKQECSTAEVAVLREEIAEMKNIVAGAQGEVLILREELEMLGNKYEQQQKEMRKMRERLHILAERVVKGNK